MRRDKDNTHLVALGENVLTTYQREWEWEGKDSRGGKIESKRNVTERYFWKVQREFKRQESLLPNNFDEANLIHKINNKRTIYKTTYQQITRSHSRQKHPPTRDRSTPTTMHQCKKYHTCYTNTHQHRGGHTYYTKMHQCRENHTYDTNMYQHAIDIVLLLIFLPFLRNVIPNCLPHDVVSISSSFFTWSPTKFLVTN